MVKRLKSKFDLNLWPQKQKRSSSGQGQHVWSIIIVCQKEMELLCGNGNKFEVQRIYKND